MRRLRCWGLSLILSMAWLYSSTALARQGDSQVVLGLGEAFGPSTLRLTIHDMDFGISAIQTLTVGQRFWRDAYYTGFGIGLHQSIGAYGLLGREFKPLSMMTINLEFMGAGDLAGYVRGLGQINIGVSW